MFFNTDLHIHTVLSPCGDLEMSPVAILERVKALHLDIIGITDHNSTRQAQIICGMGEKSGIKVLAGAEVTTREEVHCLVFFDQPQEVETFQEFLDHHLPEIKNDTDRFGHQVVVNSNNEIIYTEEKLLITALPVSIEALEAIVHGLNGLFIPAHIDRLRFGLLGQIGFIPDDLKADAMEFSPNCDIQALCNHHPEIRKYQWITGSDAHRLSDMGRCRTLLEINSKEFGSVKSVLTGNEGKRIQIINQPVNFITT